MKTTIPILLGCLLLAHAATALRTGAQPGGAPYTFHNFAGMPKIRGTADGAGKAARFSGPSGLAVDVAGNIYVADEMNHTIRKITPAGLVMTLAGTAGMPGSANGIGKGARFQNPRGVTVDPETNVYVADTFNHTIRKITPGGQVSTVAGAAGQIGSADGAGRMARFSNPHGVAADAAANVYVADFGNHTIRKITPSGAVTTLAGKAGEYGSADGPGSAARFFQPSAVAVDRSGNVYVADSENNTIRKITPEGIVTTLAGVAGPPGFKDGPPNIARIGFPSGVAVDRAGNVYLASSSGYSMIRRIALTGEVTTLAGTVGKQGSADGIGAAARFDGPHGIAVDAAGRLYVADSGNHRITKGMPTSAEIGRLW